MHSEDKADHAQLAIRIAQRTRCCVALPNYRLSSQSNTVHHPTHAGDVLAALEFLISPRDPISSRQSSSAGLNLTLDPQAPPYRTDEIYMIGHSCGAHILTSILLDSSKPTPSLTPSHKLLDAVSGVFLSEGIYDIDLLLQSFPAYREQFINLAFGIKDNYAEDSTTRYPRRPSSGHPVWMIIHSDNDSLVDLAQPQSFYDHLTSLGFASEHDWKRITTEHNAMLKTVEYSDFVGDFINKFIAKKSS